VDRVPGQNLEAATGGIVTLSGRKLSLGICTLASPSESFSMAPTGWQIDLQPGGAN
jgi:hypothetical protein